MDQIEQLSAIDPEYIDRREAARAKD